jgi:xylan 1,4-beta-xylosidase
LFFIAVVFAGGCTQKSNFMGDVQVKWNAPVGKIPQSIWGVNDYEITDYKRVSDQGFQDLMQEVAPGLIRIHYGYIADEFTDSVSRTWNEELVLKCFQEAQKAYGNAKIMMNPVAKWPDWLADKNDPLTKSQEEELIGLFTDFLKITKEHNIRVDYWEILNERENLYYKNDQLPRLWTLFNKIVSEMRSIDPDLVIGGPAFVYPKEPLFSSFLDACGRNIDFISWHNYASPDPSTPNEFILNDAVANIDSFANYVLERVDEKELDNIKEFFLTEFNIQWTWSPFETRHADHIGALYMGLVVNELSEYPLSGVTMWHFKGHSYGMIGKHNEIRPVGYLYDWGNQSLYGDRYNARYKNDTIKEYLKVMPVLKGGEKSVLFLNRSADKAPHIVLSDLSLEDEESIKILCMDKNNQVPDTIRGFSSDSKIEIPPHSVMYINSK